LGFATGWSSRSTWLYLTYERGARLITGNDEMLPAVKHWARVSKTYNVFPNIGRSKFTVLTSNLSERGDMLRFWSSVG
jgi:hypothetical protein